MSVSVKAPAKINLMLDVVGRRPDGYHTLETVFQTVDWYDRITVAFADATVIECDGDVPCDETNTAHRAARVFNEFVGCTDAYRITIEKTIPIQAGLAGGSADAAGTLVALNRLTGAGLSVDTLCMLGNKVGADVPFCVKGGTVFATGTGEQMTELPPLTDGVFMIVKPQGGVSTPEAYRLVDAKADLLHPSASAFCEALKRGDTAAMMAAVGNSFEDALRLPSCLAAKEQLLRHGAGAACMSGSGSAVFGWFTDRARAEACADTMQHGDVQVRVCVPCRGVVLE